MWGAFVRETGQVADGFVVLFSVRASRTLLLPVALPEAMSVHGAAALPSVMRGRLEMSA